MTGAPHTASLTFYVKEKRLVGPQVIHMAKMDFQKSNKTCFIYSAERQKKKTQKSSLSLHGSSGWYTGDTQTESDISVKIIGYKRRQNWGRKGNKKHCWNSHTEGETRHRGEEEHPLEWVTQVKHIRTGTAITPVRNQTEQDRYNQNKRENNTASDCMS